MRLPGALAKLTEAQADEMVGWLALGLTDTEIVNRLQKEKGWLTDVRPNTLLKSVNRWRKGGAQNAVVQQVAQKLITPKGTLRRHLDVIDELTNLAYRQKGRIEKLAAKEDAGPLLLAQVSDEMMRMTTILEKLGRFQLDTGLMRRVKVGQVLADYEEPEDETGSDGDGELWSPALEAALQVIEGKYMVVGGE